MTFTLNTEVPGVLAAVIEQNGPPPALPAGDVTSQRMALDAMLEYFNNQAQPVAGKVDISDHRVTPDGATLLAQPPEPSGAPWVEPAGQPGRDHRDGQVLVRVVAAGINPGETAIRNGAMEQMFPATFPSG